MCSNALTPCRVQEFAWVSVNEATSMKRFSWITVSGQPFATLRDADFVLTGSRSSSSYPQCLPRYDPGFYRSPLADRQVPTSAANAGLKSLFGMNVNLMANNPDWRWYLVVVATTLATTSLGWLIFKYGPVEQYLERHIGRKLELWAERARARAASRQRLASP